MTRLFLLLVPLLLSACATAPPSTEGTRGFFWGLLDGAVAPIAFVLSLFSETIAVYAVPNSGGWYDFGFLLGLTCWAGAGAAANKRSR
ncbi:hypothetical protein [Roseisalinus antarcticus]|uniref:Lipoprotein n=1 Tax=Roseisalinus antarcticus TaxID=254357 RepID=A0A1Y5T1X3_9RHOB|nr:hypothetical protein [Roseisalinus antarcticus]SLN51946.1 hypothetical protein ROA7023_02283 [Roseisalinus antarcticus]